MSNLKKTLVLLAVILGILLGTICGGFVWFRGHYVRVEGRAYSKNLQSLDLTGEELTAQQYENICKALPQCRVLWSVPIGGARWPQDSRELTLTSLQEGEIELMAYLPQLEAIHAQGCRDYEQLEKLQQAYPGIKVEYTVNVGGTEYPQDTDMLTVTSLTDEDVAGIACLHQLITLDALECTDYPQLLELQRRLPQTSVIFRQQVQGQEYRTDAAHIQADNANVAQLMEELKAFPRMETLTLTEPQGTGEEMQALLDAFPDAAITWEKQALGRTVSSGDTELDLSGTRPESLEAVAAELECFPNLEKVILSDCGFPDEEMAAFREQMRSQYKVVWTVYPCGYATRTDEIYFMPGKDNVYMNDQKISPLQYCEDMICVDIGHGAVKYLDWVRGMPHLQYLILADNWIMDLTPLGELKELKYLELFMNKHIKDYTPLIGCTALEDVNAAVNFWGNHEVFAQMPWLKNLWVNRNDLDADTRALLTESLPDTHIEFDHGWPTGGGWRQLPNYYKCCEIREIQPVAW